MVAIQLPRQVSHPPGGLEFVDRGMRVNHDCHGSTLAKRRQAACSVAEGAPCTRVRHGMIQLAWRFLWYQPDCALVQWYRERTGADRNARKKLIVALARKLQIALWRFVTQGLVPEGVVFHPAR